MSNIIESKHPFEIKNLNDINEYFVILKNILRLLSKKNFKQKINGLTLPVRQSTKNLKWVVDFGSDKLRDIEGIHLDNLRFYYNENTTVFNSINHILNKINNCSKIDLYASLYKLDKNENRFLSFVVNQDLIYFTGLYNRCQTKKRSGIYSNKKKKSILIDDSEDFLKATQQYLDFITLPSFYKKNFDYQTAFKKFFNQLENESFFYIDNLGNIKKDFIKNYYHLKNNNCKIKIKNYIESVKKINLIKENNVFYFLILHITILFNRFLLDYLNFENNNDIIFFDNVSDTNIKIVSEFKVNLFEEEKVLKIPLFPVSF